MTLAWLVVFVGPVDTALWEVLEHVQRNAGFRVLLEKSDKVGFVASREYLADHFLNDTHHLIDNKIARQPYSHWIHLDDDMLLGSGMGVQRNPLYRGLSDYEQHGGHMGLLVLYLNNHVSGLFSHYSKHVALPRYGPLAGLDYAGAPAFIVNRATLDHIGKREGESNPYTLCKAKDVKHCPEGETANFFWWDLLRTHGLPLLSNVCDAYPVQHLANTHSLIHGYQKGWG